MSKVVTITLIALVAAMQAPALTQVQVALPSTETLMFVGGTDKMAHFIVRGENTDRFSVVDLRYLEIYDPPIKAGEKEIAQIVGVDRLNCNNRRHQVLGGMAYTETGEVVGSIPPTSSSMERVVRLSPSDMRATIVCDGVLPQVGPGTKSYLTATEAIAFSREWIGKQRNRRR